MLGLLSLTAGILAMSGHVISANTTYSNPIIPGYRPDPSCTSVGDTVYCVSSSFNNFPGLPVYASKDLVNWRHISNAIHNQTQVPEYSQIKGTQEGIYAPTLRYRNGTFYIIVTFMGASDSPFNLLFRSNNPHKPESWGKPLKWRTPQLGSFDPDIFWDDDGQAYVTVHVFDIVGNNMYPFNTETGEFGQSWNIWNGTGGVWPEGPHIYKKDGYYYILIAEGGTGSDHMVTMARSASIKGPFQAYDKNPVLTNKGTNEYFQAVGHADLFKDVAGNWWGVALSVRTGTTQGATPMGRETVLFPVTWNEGEYPIAQPVRGSMSGPLPPKNRDVPGVGSFVGDEDNFYFSGRSLPLHFVHNRFPPANSYEIRDSKLRVNPSRANLTGPATYNPSTDPSAYIGRRQTDTLFNFTVDLEYTPSVNNEEAGVSLFLTRFQHAEVGVLMQNGARSIRFRVTADGTDSWKNYRSSDKIISLPAGFPKGPVRLQIAAVNDTVYQFSYGSSTTGGKLTLAGTANATLVSGGLGSFVGSTIGVYATSNGGNGKTPAVFSNWRYKGLGQKTTR